VFIPVFRTSEGKQIVIRKQKGEMKMRQATAFSVMTTTLLVLMLVSVQAQTSQNFTMTNVGGTGKITLGMELDGTLADLGICAGDSSLLVYKRFGPWSYPVPDSGKFTCTTIGWMTRTEWAPSAENCPGGLESIVETNIQNHIIRFADGDLMYWVPDEEDESYLCFYPEEGMLTITGYWKVIGGSGRFLGVTGEATWTAQVDGVPLGPDPEMGVVAAHDGFIEGTIVYPE